jgi:hypothetical protein
MTPLSGFRVNRRDRRRVRHVAGVAEGGFAQRSRRPMRDNQEPLGHGQGRSVLVAICREMVRPTRRDTKSAT